MMYCATTGKSFYLIKEADYLGSISSPSAMTGKGRKWDFTIVKSYVVWEDNKWSMLITIRSASAARVHLDACRYMENKSIPFQRVLNAGIIKDGQLGRLQNQKPEGDEKDFGSTKPAKLDFSQEEKYSTKLITWWKAHLGMR